MAEPPIAFFAGAGWLAAGAGIMSTAVAQSLAKKAATEADRARAAAVQAFAIRMIAFGFGQFFLSIVGLLVSFAIPASMRWYSYVAIELALGGSLAWLLAKDALNDRLAKQVGAGASLPSREAEKLLGSASSRRGRVLAHQLRSREQTQRDLRALVLTLFCAVGGTVGASFLSDALSFAPIGLVAAFIGVVLLCAKVLALRRLGYAAPTQNVLLAESDAELLMPGGEFAFLLTGPLLRAGSELEVNLLGEQRRGDFESTNEREMTIRLGEARVQNDGRAELKPCHSWNLAFRSGRM